MYHHQTCFVLSHSCNTAATLLQMLKECLRSDQVLCGLVVILSQHMNLMDSLDCMLATSLFMYGLHDNAS